MMVDHGGDVDETVARANDLALGALGDAWPDANERARRAHRGRRGRERNRAGE